MKRRILSFVVGVCLVLGLVPSALLSDFFSVIAEAAETSGTCGSNLTWELDEDTGLLTISGTGTMTSYSSGEAPWYDLRGSITKVVIEDGVTSVGAYAFYNCTLITSVSIADTVTSFGNYAFYSCYALSNVTISDSVTSMGNYTFEYCSALSSVTIGNGISSIGGFGFAYCTRYPEKLIRKTKRNTYETAGRNVEESMFPVLYLCYTENIMNV